MSSLHGMLFDVQGIIVNHQSPLSWSMDSQQTSKKILMFPWLAHGHIFPYLQLAKKISNKKNFHFYLCTTAVNFPSITSFLRKNSLQNSITTVQLHLHPNPDFPPHLQTTKNLPSHLTLSLIKAFQTSQSSFSHILSDLHPNLLLFDGFQPWAATSAASLRIPAVHFSPIGAATKSYFHHAYTLPDPHFPFPHLLLRPSEKRSFDSLHDRLLNDVFDHNPKTFFVNTEISSEVVLFKTTHSLEDKYINYVSSFSHKRILPVGPLVDNNNNKDDEDEVEVEIPDIMRWLGEKEKHSTVYISFGSEYFLSDEEISEIAKGLELCKANFIWVIRFPAEEEREVVPEGFLERVGERGRVVVGWAPQERILRHASVGAFVSHCGWSSVNESVYHGVPVVAMPVKMNMFVDARMLVEAGVCVEVEREEDGWFKGEEIGKAIGMVVGEKGEGLRWRARELSEKMKMEEEAAIDQVANKLWELCI